MPFLNFSLIYYCLALIIFCINISYIESVSCFDTIYSFVPNLYRKPFESPRCFTAACPLAPILSQIPAPAGIYADSHTRRYHAGGRNSRSSITGTWKELKREDRWKHGYCPVLLMKFLCYSHNAMGMIIIYECQVYMILYSTCSAVWKLRQFYQ